MSEEISLENGRLVGITHDGFLYDAESGEVIGYKGFGGVPLEERWEIATVEHADWALELRSGIEGEIAGIEAQLEAVTKMLQARKSAAMRKLSWWEFRFGPSLIAFARTCLSGKSRTVQFSWGRVSFRRTGGNNEIINMKAAVEWMRDFDSSKVKVKEFVNVTDLLEAKKISDRWDEEEEGVTKHPTPFLVSSEPSENVTITTGIEINREERTTR